MMVEASFNSSSNNLNEFTARTWFHTTSMMSVSVSEAPSLVKLVDLILVVVVEYCQIPKTSFDVHEGGRS